MRTIYRKEALHRGVDVRTKAEWNIDDWLDATSPKYNKTFADAFFHYQARAERGQRFEACVATAEMNNAAWQYCHMQQMILDGTFGVCDRKLLLFIAMGIDGERKGVPVAFFFFSAPSGNQQTSAGYDTAILTKLLGQWKSSLEAWRGGQKFEPACAITDTDLRERAALLATWKNIVLLICKFHLRQAWRNYRNKTLKGKSPRMMELKTRMAALEVALVASTSYIEAVMLVEAEWKFVQSLASVDSSAASKATAYLDYMESFWMQDHLWRSWSGFARTNAARVLKCDVVDVLPTTNHLESFNGILKRKLLKRFQHGTKRLRLDVLLHILISDIVPSLFQRRRLVQLQQDALDQRIRSIPGGEELIATRNARAKQKPIPVAFYVPDPARDAAARALLTQNRLHNISMGTAGVDATCFSSQATAANPTSYTLRAGFDSTADCSCPDFHERGGACKHIRALLVALDGWRAGTSGTAPIVIPPTILPVSEHDARELALRRATSATIHSDAPPGAAPDSGPMPPLGAGTVPSTDDGLFESMDGDSEPEQLATEEDEDEDDTRSVATDADDDDDEFSAPFTGAPSNGTNSSVAAFHEQVSARVARQLQQFEPHVGDINEFLSNADPRRLPASELPAIRRALGAYKELVGHLERWVDGAGTQFPTNTTSSTPSSSASFVEPNTTPNAVPPVPPAQPVPPTHPHLVSYPHRPRQLVAVSPERKQRRHDSHAIW